jgi:capsular exopolysaccharide synthesis family protein
LVALLLSHLDIREVMPKKTTRRNGMYNFVELRDVIMLVLKRWWLLVLAALIGGALGYALTAQQAPVYAAKTTLFVGRSIQANDLDRTALQTGQQLAITYAEIIRRQPVLQGTINALQLTTSWQALRSRISVSQVGETQLIEITAEAASPREAEQVVAEVARQLILLSPSSGNLQTNEETFQFVQQRLLTLQSSIASTQSELQSVQLALAALEATSIEAGALRIKIDDLQNRLLEWDNLYARLLTFISDMQATNQLSVIEPAQAQTSPVRPRLELNVAAGVFGLLALAMLLIFLLAYLDDTFKSGEELARHTDLALLGTVRQLAGKTTTDRLITKQTSFAQAAEDYRLAYSKLHFTIHKLPRKVIMVTSPTPGEGKSLVTANLAVAMAEAGLHVVIVDANLRRPTQHQIFGIANTNGLTELLHAPLQHLDTYLKSTAVLNLQIVTAGTLPAHSAAMLGSAQMQHLLDRLAAAADVIICDSPEATGVADAAILARQVSGVLVVVNKHKMQRRLIKEALKNLAQVGSPVIGLVLNHPNSGLGAKQPAVQPSTPLPLALPSPQNVEAGDD